MEEVVTGQCQNWRKEFPSEKQTNTKDQLLRIIFFLFTLEWEWHIWDTLQNAVIALQIVSIQCTETVI